MTLAKLLNFLELWFPHLGRIIGPASKGKIEGKRRRVQKRLKWLNSIADSTDMNLSKLQEIVENKGAWRGAVSPWDCKESDMI